MASYSVVKPERPKPLARIVEHLRAESFFALIVGAGLLMRFFLADWNSYWYDELLSVDVYGVSHTTVIDALRHLAQASVHPPLYQFALYNWMFIFGDSEIATRSLSNIYIGFATVFLYLLARDVFSRRIALMTAVTFSLMNVPVYYALESRSYAQTILAVTMSSYFLVRVLLDSETKGWREALISPVGVVFVLSNFAVLMTHYYNVFFLVAQATICLIYVLAKIPPRRWGQAFGALALLYLVPVGLFAAVWGRILISTYDRFAEDFEVDDSGALLGTWDLLQEAVLSPNLKPPIWVGVLGLVVVIVVGIRAVSYALGRGRMPSEAHQGWTVLYLFGWLILPIVAVTAAFTLFGVARYLPRYFVFSVPPLAVLIVLAVEQAGQLVSAVRPRRPNLSSMRWVALIWVAVVLLLVLPEGQRAATARKDDWRGNVQRVINVVGQTPSSTFIIFEAAHRREPMSNFYFERISSNIRTYDTVQRTEERRGGPFRIMTSQRETIEEHDCLIVLFPHLRTSHFPEALSQLEALYAVRHRQLDRQGRGFIVLSVSDSC